jgi:hypothetical protein
MDDEDIEKNSDNEQRDTGIVMGCDSNRGRSRTHYLPEDPKDIEFSEVFNFSLTPIYTSLT